MVSIPQIVGRMSRGLLLCASLYDPAQAAENVKPNECAEIKGGQRDHVKCEEDKRQGVASVKGELLHIEEGQYVVRQFYGKEVRLHTDASTQVTGAIGLGDSVEAIVSEENDQKHLLSIRRIQQ